MYLILSLLMATTFSNSFTAQPPALPALVDANNLEASVYDIQDVGDGWTKVSHKKPVIKDGSSSATTEEALAPLSGGDLPDSMVVVAQPQNNWWKDFVGQIGAVASQVVRIVREEAQGVWQDLKETLSEPVEPTGSNL